MFFFSFLAFLFGLTVLILLAFLIVSGAFLFQIKTNILIILFLYRVALSLNSASLTNIKSLLVFFLFTIIGSNVFSNVPLTLIVLQQVPPVGDHLSLVLYLAFLTTIAGNLTLFGSVANLIVAQKAWTSSIKYRFDFWTYLKFGFPTTILLSLFGMFIIYGLLAVNK
jgi:Na+/H+ antiporter NhaD/arsenite permease-like protein